MKKNIAVLGGDGIGPEVTHQGVKVLKWVAARVGMEVELEEALIAGAAYDATGNFCPPETLTTVKKADAILFGASGGPKYDALPPTVDKRALLRLRQELGLFANIRPAWFMESLESVSPLKRSVTEGCDMLVLRELGGGIYYGQPKGFFEEDGVRAARNTMIYRVPEIERIVRKGFELARARRKKLTSVDKANVLDVSKLWRETATRLAADYPDVELDHLHVDVAAMELVRNPRRFDTVVTGNLFGDILTDEIAVISGSLGMMPSASLGEKHALYEPIHGSAPDIAGQDKANPLGAILSVAMMFRYSFGHLEAAQMIHDAVDRTLAVYRTGDIADSKLKTVGCQEMGDRVVESLEKGAR